jgi:hypothetical protein
VPEQPQHAVVVDTNILWSNNPFRESVPWTNLLSYAAKYAATHFAVPEVVVHELARQEADQIARSRAEGVRALGRARAEFTRAGIDFPAVPTVRDVRDLVLDSRHVIAEQMRADLATAGILVPSIPQFAHETLLAWSLDAHPPFDSTDKGYRDALIWRTVRDNAAGQPAGSTTVFVAADNDYTKKPDKTGTPATGSSERVLHPKLADDLSQVTANTVIVVRTMQQAIKILVELDQGKGDTEDKEPCAADEFETLDGHPSRDELLGEQIETACELLVGEDIGSSYDGPSPKFEYDIPDVENATVTAVTPDLSTLSVDVHERFDGDTLIGDVSVAAEISYDGYVAKADVWEESGSWRVWDSDWNDHYALVEGELHAELTFQFVLRGADVTLEFNDVDFRE